MAARKILAILAGASFGYAWYAAFAISLTAWALWLCLSMLCLIGNGCIRWVSR